MSCDKIINEANKIITTSCEIQEKLNSNGKEEIVNLLTMMKAKKPCYTAAGYIILNRNTLFSILSTTATYFIILLQLNRAMLKQK